MMTKRTSPLRAGFITGTAATLFMLLTLASGLQSVAQVPIPAPERKPASANRSAQQPDPVSLEQRFGNKLVRTVVRGKVGEPGKEVYKKFSDLSEAEKKHVILIPPRTAQTPTEKQFNDWKNPKRYGIWLDGKHVKHSILDTYTPGDIASFWSSYVHKNARQPQGYVYQVDLMTHKA